jgi:hypothetical protein
MVKFLNQYLKFLVLLGSSSYVAYKTLQIYLKRRKYCHIPGPPTDGILGFYFGNVLNMPKYLENGKIFNQFLLEWLLFKFLNLFVIFTSINLLFSHEKYGEIFKIQFLSEIILITNQKESIKV